jgi:phosphatidylinositol-3-phosphatase
VSGSRAHVRTVGPFEKHRFPRLIASLVVALGLGVSALVAAHDSSAPTSLTPAASSTTRDITAAADSYLQSSQPTSNFGTSASDLVEGSPARRTYIKFHNPEATAPTTATLSVTSSTKYRKGFVVRPASSSWAETDITWNNAPSPSTAICGTSGPIAAGKTVSVAIDISACPILASADTTFVLETSSRTTLTLTSRESATPPILHLSWPSSTTSPTASPTSTPTTSPTSTPTSSPTTSPTSSPTAPSGSVTKLLVFVEENHSLSQMEAGMPYTFSLAQRYGYATNYTAIRHPSLPNYIAIAGGQTYGITDDNPPSSHPLNGSSVFGQAIAAGKTAKVYADGMTSNCMASNTGSYVVKHNPWPFFTPQSETQPCSTFDVPETQLAGDITNGTLPNVGMVIPNLCNDAHDCALSVADGWFKTRMEKIFAGPDWKSGHLAVVLTADEDDSSSGNKVLTVVIHPSQNGKVVASALTHYSLTSLYEDVAQAPYLFNAATAPSLSAAFGLPMN